MVIADVRSGGLTRDGDLRAVYGLFTFAPRGWRVQIRRVRSPVRKARQAIIARRVPGGPLLVHKMLEARYRHHDAMVEAARPHSGLPKLLPLAQHRRHANAHFVGHPTALPHVDPVHAPAPTENYGSTTHADP